MIEEINSSKMIYLTLEGQIDGLFQLHLPKFAKNYTESKLSETTMGVNSSRFKSWAIVWILRIQDRSLYRRFAEALRPKIQIKKASEKDWKAFYYLMNPGQDDPPPQDSSGAINFVAKKKDAIVGFVQLVRRPESEGIHAGYWLFSLVVRLRHRGMGIGEALSRKVIAEATQEGAEKLKLFVFEDSRPAVQLYKKLGFEEVIIPELVPKLEEETKQLGRKRIVMEKLL